MSFILKGALQGALCGQCTEPLSGVVIRAYALAPEQNAVALAAAHAKDTFVQLDDEQRDAKSARLLAEAVIGADGSFELNFGDKAYDGGPVEMDLYCATVPGRRSDAGLPAPMQFSITTLQPRWREVDDDRIGAWSYTLPWRIWCGIRGRFGAWVICGVVRHCATQAPIGGVRVRAFDVDWLQDDALGDAITDAGGRFRIDYLTSDFTATIFPGLNLEWTGGPDVYFRIETLGGAPLLTEAASRGRAADRENVGPCFCVDLCVDQSTTPPDTEPLPVFDALGGYHYPTAIQSAVPGSGLTVADQRAFYNNVRLNGVLPKTLAGQPLEYRFEYRRTNATGTPIGPWSPIDTTQFGATLIGRRERYAPAFPGDPNPVKTTWVYADPASPAADEAHAAIVAGWIRVPQASNVYGADGFFVPNGNMLQALTHELVTQPALDMSGVLAGESSTAHGAALAVNAHIGLRMRVRAVGQPATETDAGHCAHVAIENTAYQNVHKGGSWSPQSVSGQLCACSVDTQELRIGGGCAGMNSSLTVLFTAAHPNLGAVQVTMAGPGGPHDFTLPVAITPGDRFGVANYLGDFASLDDCAYIVTLSVPLLLTTGDSAPLPVLDQIAFCKK